MSENRFPHTDTANTLVVLAALALLIAVFLKPVEVQKPTYKLMVTFDISQSMGVEDHFEGGANISRLNAAKKAAGELLEELPCGSSVGWSIFTGRRVLSLIKPEDVCQHYAGLLTSLNFIDGRMRWANASGVGKGLHQSIRAADEIDQATTVVFITDGHEAPPLRVGSRGMPKSDQYETDGVIVGVGGSVPVRIPKFDDDGNRTGYWLADEVVQRMDDASVQSHEELSRRQDEHLGNLARLSGLAYMTLDSTDALVNTIKQDRYAKSQLVSVELRWMPALVALLLLCFRFLPVLRRFDRQS